MIGSQLTPNAQQQHVLQPPATDGGAIASLVLGIIGVMGCLALAGIPALILGVTARRRITQSGGTRQGEGLAIAGIILGALGLLETLGAVAIAVPLVLSARGGYRQAQSNNARTSAHAIQAAADLWRVDHADDCPTAAQLEADGELSPSSTIDDPWGMPYVIDCTSSTTSVRSFGPDRTDGTADDVEAR